MSTFDRFGKNVFTINSEQVRLPRTERCSTIYKTALLLKLSKIGSYSYEVLPYVSEKNYSNKESLLKIREIIWYNFFQYKKDYYRFENRYHYPTPFSVYLKHKLNLTVNEDDVDVFVEQIRNSVFNLVVYSPDPSLISAATRMTDGSLKMTDIHKYVIKDYWENWSKFKNKEK